MWYQQRDTVFAGSGLTCGWICVAYCWLCSYTLLYSLLYSPCFYFILYFFQTVKLFVGASRFIQILSSPGACASGSLPCSVQEILRIKITWSYLELFMSWGPRWRSTKTRMPGAYWTLFFHIYFFFTVRTLSWSTITPCLHFLKDTSLLKYQPPQLWGYQ